MISYLGALDQYSPAAVRAGRCRQMSPWMGSTCSAQAARRFGGLSPGAARLFPPQRAAQAASSFGGLSSGAARHFSPRRAARAARGLCALSLWLSAPFPLRLAAQAARCLAPSPLARCAFSLRGPSARRWSGLRKSLDRNRGLFAVWEGMASLGLSLPLSPPCCLLSPARMGRFFSGVSQSLCFENRRWCVLAC